MEKQTYILVAAVGFLRVAEESIDEIFRMNFANATRRKRIINTNSYVLNIFEVEFKKIEFQAIKRFENFLKSAGLTKLYSSTYTNFDDIDVRFFTINLDVKHFADMKEQLTSKIEEALGKKLKRYEGLYQSEIYYFQLTKSQIKSRRLIKLIDELLMHPAIKIITYA
jgi:hypothetical protein